MKVVSRFHSSDFDRPSLLLQSKGCKVEGFESQVEEKITMTRARLSQRRGICEKIHITTWGLPN
ncbi:hypothetical protein HanPSC8_Chr07g0305741 [Helianthus annuus]|nr:hypothetical protein HanIR_Chr07g0341211 [Helianthus annuus]KAJ0906469.1 hypothetical protein HanPSC8_Chr07g0305741 [Helianthus annuus]